MRKQLFLSFFLISLGFCAGNILASDDADDIARAECKDVFGHTFFYVRPVFQSFMPERITMFRDAATARCDEYAWDGAFQFVGFGGRSTNRDGKELARFFFPCPKDELFVSTQDELTRDIDAAQFFINYVDGGTAPGFFKSTIAIRPRQTFGGLGITWRQHLASRCACEKPWWFSVSGPILHVKNKVRLEESNVMMVGTPAANTPANMVAAFQGNTLLPTGTTMAFGLINDEEKTSRTRLGDVEVKLGYEWINDECYHYSGYAGILIPAGNRPKGIKVFEPIIGHNFHFGFLLGAEMGFEVWGDCDRSFRIEYDIDARYFLSKTETRAFDLKNRGWSRYMRAYRDQADVTSQTTVPGINIFTQPMKISPRWAVNLTTGFIYDHCNFRGEIGWNVYAHQAEKAKLDEPWQEGPAIAQLNSLTGEGDGTVDLLGNIARQCSEGVNYVATGDNRTVIKVSDINLCSATMPAALSNLVYGSLGYRWDEWCYPAFVGFGASYEWGAVNTVLDRWLVWLKLGFSI